MSADWNGRIRETAERLSESAKAAARATSDLSIALENVLLAEDSPEIRSIRNMADEAIRKAKD
jgi:hypothetical protein